MLFFMGAASHLSLANPTTGGQQVGALVLLLIVLAAAEVNALVGPASPDKAGAGKKLLATLNGTFWAGFVLTVILYLGLEIIFP
jgi:hypothetical protein